MKSYRTAATFAFISPYHADLERPVSSRDYRGFVLRLALVDFFVVFFDVARLGLAAGFFLTVERVFVAPVVSFVE